MHTIFSIDFPIAIIDGGDNFEIFEYGGEEGKQTNEKLEKSVKSYVRLSVGRKFKKVVTKRIERLKFVGVMVRITLKWISELQVGFSGT